MPAPRNQAVTVRRPRASSMPTSSRGRRAALRRSSQPARATKALVSKAGRYDNGMAGSSGARWGLATVIVRRGPALGPPPATPQRTTLIKDYLGHRDDALMKSRKVQVFLGPHRWHGRGREKAASQFRDVFHD